MTTKTDRDIVTHVLLLAVVCAAVLFWAIAQQYHRIDILAGAEDDCHEYYGAYRLSEVLPNDRGSVQGVICRYR